MLLWGLYIKPDVECRGLSKLTSCIALNGCRFGQMDMVDADKFMNFFSLRVCEL